MDNTGHMKLTPPLKWAGGKRWLVPRLLELWDTEHRHRRLVEPFVGGMSVALGLHPHQALLNDVNPHLINFYQKSSRKAPRLQAGEYVNSFVIPLEDVSMTTALAIQRLQNGDSVYSVHQNREYQIIFIGCKFAITLCGHLIPTRNRVWYTD